MQKLTELSPSLSTQRLVVKRRGFRVPLASKDTQRDGEYVLPLCFSFEIIDKLITSNKILMF